MTDTPAATKEYDESELYEIRLTGQLDNKWAMWFEGMTITRDKIGETRITGKVVDQAALHGLLRRVRDLGLPLISVVRVRPCATGVSENTCCCAPLKQVNSIHL